MLPASARVRSRSEHRLVAARGRRSRRGPLVVHLLDASAGVPPVAAGTAGSQRAVTVGTARAGVVVGKRVGPAVSRNLVKRRLREQLRNRLPHVRAGSLVVVRALPGAADADFDRLGRSLDSALRALDALAPEAVAVAAERSGADPEVSR